MTFAFGKKDVPAAKLLHRIPSPTREQGDGMEATSPDEPQTAAIQAKPKVKINQQKSVTPPPVTSRSGLKHTGLLRFHGKKSV